MKEMSHLKTKQKKIFEHKTASPAKQWKCRHGRNRKIFLRGQSNFSWFISRRDMLFPGSNFHFGRPKTNFSRLEKWKEKKRKKKPSSFPFFHFQFFTFLFTILFFSSPFSPFPFFSLPLFFLVGQHKFPIRSLGGAPCPLPPPRLLRHWMQIRLCCTHTTRYRVMFLKEFWICTKNYNCLTAG